MPVKVYYRPIVSKNFLPSQEGSSHMYIYVNYANFCTCTATSANNGRSGSFRSTADEFGV